MDELNRILIAALFVAGTFGGGYIASNTLESQAIERGYALYCPTDGDFAWVGECEEE